MSRFPTKYLLAILLLPLWSACGNLSRKDTKEQKIVNNGQAKVEFAKDFHNFGELEAREQISYSFKFHNLGDGILRIDSIQNDCACMKITFPQEDIMPQDFSYVDVLFNPAGEYGRVFKQIKVFCNAQTEPVELTLVADVSNPMFDKL
ncbi:MAG: DUF1573 domain-containing protein [Mangrovibacterium sp.]